MLMREEGEFEMAHRKSVHTHWLIFLGIIGFMSVDGFTIEAQNKQTINWTKTLAAFDAYLELPSPMNAKAIVELLPQQKPDNIIGETSQALEYIISGENYGILATEAIAGDKCSVEVLFRLLNLTDGFATEIVLGTLGTVVRMNPRLFLKVLNENLDMWYIATEGYPVEFPGYAHNNHPGASKYDLEMRIRALESVEDLGVDKIKQDCIRKLREELKRFEHIKRLSLKACLEFY